MATDMYNPIRAVDGVAIPTPSKYEYNLQDISKSDAGRTQDGKMHKNRIGQTKKIELEWQNISTDKVSTILQAFNPEYINVTYLDALTGSYVTSEFYVGDRSAPAYNTKMGLWQNVAFNIIERGCR